MTNTEKTMTAPATAEKKALCVQLDELNALIREGKDATADLARLSANVKTNNDERRNDHAASLKCSNPRATMIAYINSQYYSTLRLSLDKDTMQYSLNSSTARLTYPQLCSVVCTDKATLISTKANWARYLECFCDNIAVQAVNGGHITRTTKKGGAFTSPVDMLEFKKSIGFDKDEISNKELMRELEAVFAAVLPADMIDCDGDPLTPVKADLKKMVAEFMKSYSTANYNGFKESSATNMERALFAALEKRYNKQAYPLQAAASSRKAAPASETEKAVAAENAGAPDTTTTPAAGDVKVVAEKKTTRKASAKKTEPAA